MVARRLGKPRQLKLLGDELVAVDENQTAGVEHDRPSSRWVNYAITDIHCVPNHIAKIFDHSHATASRAEVLEAPSTSGCGRL